MKVVMKEVVMVEMKVVVKVVMKMILTLRGFEDGQMHR